MEPLKGFRGFDGMHAGMQPAAPPQATTQGQGSTVFAQIMQQLQVAQQSKKTAAKSKVDMLWPMGTAMKEKV